MDVFPRRAWQSFIVVEVSLESILYLHPPLSVIHSSAMPMQNIFAFVKFSDNSRQQVMHYRVDGLNKALISFLTKSLWHAEAASEQVLPHPLAANNNPPFVLYTRMNTSHLYPEGRSMSRERAVWHLYILRTVGWCCSDYIN